MDQTDTAQLEDKARGILASRRTLFLSTSAQDQPWVAGTFFAESDPFTLAIVLEPNGRTLTNIRSNSRISVVVSAGSPFEPYLQGEGEATVLETKAEAEATQIALVAKAPESKPFFDYPLIPVALRIRRWRVTDVQTGLFPGRELLAPTSVTAP